MRNTTSSFTSSGISSNQTISTNNIYEIPESDVPVLVGEDIQEMFESVQKEAFTDWDKKTDNETDLEDLLGGEVIAADMSWYFAKYLSGAVGVQFHDPAAGLPAKQIAPRRGV